MGGSGYGAPGTWLSCTPRSAHACGGVGSVCICQQEDALEDSGLMTRQCMPAMYKWRSGKNARFYGYFCSFPAENLID